jgi:phosphatidylglycerophosphatase C
MQIAIFDLDGTITHHETLFPYVWGFVWRHPLYLLKFPLVIPALIRYFFARDRAMLKERFMRCMLGNIVRRDLQAWTQVFAQRVISHGAFDAAHQRIKSHRHAGHKLILMSASPDLYVEPIGRLLGFDEVICTQVAWNGDRFDGRLLSDNCRGEEKLRQIMRLQDKYPNEVMHAYGNMMSDLPHLARAQHPVLVNGSKEAQDAARELGISCEQWH